MLSYLTFQYERGQETGRLHLQGYCELTDRKTKTLAVLRRLFPQPHTHLEPRRGSQAQAIAYCSKEDTRVAPGTTVGDPYPLQQGKRRDLEELAAVARTKSISELDLEYGGDMLRYGRMMTTLSHRSAYRDAPAFVENRRVYLLQGPTGVGKTRAARRVLQQEHLVCPIVTKGKVWFPANYDPRQHTHCLFDEFEWENVSISYLLRLLDTSVSTVEIKGGDAPFLCTRIVFCTNVPFDEWFPSASEAQRKALRRRFFKIITVRPPQWMRHRPALEVTIDADDLEDSLQFEDE